MDRNDSNPGMVERQMDETPMEGSGTERDSMQGACGPPYQSSAAASAPCSWSMSHMSPRFLMSSSSQRRAETRWVSSDSGWMEQYSVQTAA